jgi:hypothetical protein
VWIQQLEAERGWLFVGSVVALGKKIAQSAVVSVADHQILLVMSH